MSLKKIYKLRFFELEIIINLLSGKSAFSSEPGNYGLIKIMVNCSHYLN